MKVSMKVLFIGEYTSNSGPSNVNKGIIANLTPEYEYVTSVNKWLAFLEAIIKLLHSNVLVVSGITRRGVMMCKICKLLHKKVIYIMHGCYKEEMRLNEEVIDEKVLCYENFLLEKSDLILAVSKKFMKWVQSHYSRYAAKIDYLYNGVERETLSVRNIARSKNSMIAVGGDRKQKNNMAVSEAISMVDQNIKLNICGRIHKPDMLEKNENTIYHGLLTKQELYELMAASEVFVLNSIFEPFSLAVIDALNCGCSVLVSQYAGITDLLPLEDSDIIFDPMDKHEIADKIKYLLDHPNNCRLFSNLDFSKLSFKSEVEKLTMFCKKIINE